MTVLIVGLVIVLAVGGLLLWREYRVMDAQRQMLSAIINEGAGGAAITGDGPASIRSVQTSQSRFSRMLIRVFGIRPNVRGMNLVPWQAVVLVTVPAGYGFYFVATILVALPLALSIGIIGGYALGRGIFAWQANRYRQKLFDQLPDVIELVVGAVSAGMPVDAAFAQVARDIIVPTRDEFAKVMADVAVGRPIDQAILRIFERTNVAEYAILATTIGLQSGTGGKISESMQNLGQIIRERHAVSSRARARASESKLSGNILAVMPIVFAVMMSFINPGYLDVFITDPSAERLMILAVAMLAFGVLLMRLIIRWSVTD